MSYQTKEQSMGYLIKAFSLQDFGTKTIKEVISIADELIGSSNGEYANEDTTKVFRAICKKLKLSEEQESQLSSTLHWEGFDYTTVGEAEEIYKAYLVFQSKL